MTKSTILVIDNDNSTINILQKTLEYDYNVVIVNNGRDALDVLSGDGRVDVVLTDIFIPPLPGWQMLHQIYKKKYSDIPVIAMSNVPDYRMERKAFAEGAWDFVSKPINPDIILSRLKNAIAKSKMNYMEELQRSYEYDRLTGFYNRRKLFNEINDVLEQPLSGQYVYTCIDIDRFHQFNSSLGEDEGDALIVFISQLVHRLCEKLEGCLYGRLEAEVFCVFGPYNKEVFESNVEEVIHEICNYKDDYVIEPSVGVYVFEDENPTVETMVSRAKMAALKCKNRYHTYIGYYDHGMDEQNATEQEIINEMESALEKEEFKVYVQPKYNIQIGEPCGGEALVRWESPKKGLISPALFVPIFEKNGFIVKLDYYMWENTCKLLKKQKDENGAVLPVSVNISRISLYNPQIVNILKELVSKYDIEPKYLQLEITESAYMSNPELMQNTLKNLQALGFLILMDDFGSGYSSLNTLKDIDVDILKIDMECVPKKRDNSKSEKILVSILGMSNRLGIPAIVEGVETEEQLEFLKDMGCVYVQGFYYSKPVPKADYEKLITDYFKDNKISNASDEVISSDNNEGDAPYYIKEISKYINFLKESFDVVRLVDPEITTVLEIDENDNLVDTPYSCFSVWNREIRCENCSSMCAEYEKCQKTKYEFIENDIFYVISKPITIVDRESNTRKCVLEVVSHVSDSILLRNVNNKSMKELLEETQQKIYKDELTDVYNRRYFSEKLFAHKNMNTVADKIGFIIADINEFKQINDKYGHNNGDLVLKLVADEIKSLSEDQDSVIRYGGDEFLIVLPNKNQEAINNTIKEIKDRISNIKFGFDTDFNITIACGGSFIKDYNYNGTNLTEYLDEADRIMYEDKVKMKA